MRKKSRKEKNNNKISVLSADFPLFLILCLVLLSSYFVANTLSKYAYNNDGTSNSSVAKWDVSLNARDAVIELVHGQRLGETYTLRVKNDSEVACSYAIRVSNIPYDVSISFDNESPISSGGWSMGNGGGIIGGPWYVIKRDSFNLNDSTYHEHTITFQSPSLDTNLIDRTNITVSVTFDQAN